MTLFTLSPDLVRGLACAAWLAVLIALVLRRPAWRAAPGGVRLILAGLAVIGAGLLIGALFAALHRLAVSPDRVAAEAISLIAGLFILAGVLRYRAAPAGPADSEAEDLPDAGAVETRATAVETSPDTLEECFGENLALQMNTLEQFQIEKQEAMARLAGGLAHDFSNVLTVILTASEILLMDKSLPENVRRRIERMNNAAQRGAGLTDQLRIYAGRQELMAERVDLHDLLRSDAVKFKMVLGQDIELRYDLADGPCPVMIDHDRMCAAIITILAYCRSALPEGGHVELFTRFLPEPAAGQAVLTDVSDSVALIIARSGHRMPTEQANRLLLEPYSFGTSSAAGGGLGLSLVAGFFRQSGARVRFIEEPEMGTALEIRLPLASGADQEGVLDEDGLPTEFSPAPAAAPAAPVPAAPVSAETGRLHVLVVDDNDLMRDVAAAELASLGCTATVAATPAEGLDRLENDPSIGALLSDLTFHEDRGPSGDRDGNWLVREARARFPHLQIVLMSGDIAGADGVADENAILLAKPFTRAQLAASLGLEK